MDHDRIFEQIDMAIKGYVRSRHAPLATLRFITRIVEAANEVQKAEAEKHDAENARKEAQDAYNEALEREKNADARFLAVHEALDEIIGSFGTRSGAKSDLADMLRDNAELMRRGSHEHHLLPRTDGNGRRVLHPPERLL